MDQPVPSSDIVRPIEPPLPAETVRLPARGFAVSKAKALAVSAVCWAGWGAMVWAVLHQQTGALDRTGLMWLRSGPDFGALGPAYVTEAVRDLTALGGVFLSTLATIAAIVALLFLKLRREAVLFAATVILGWMLNNTMKALIGRERPSLVPHLTDAGGMSFPSGHSFASAMIYIGMALAFASLSQRHSVRYTLIGVAMVLSMLIAWSRVLLGVHYPSDVIAGWLGGAGWAFLASALLYKPARAAADSRTAEKLDPTKHVSHAPR
jgi:undecaprenyl-diphosphatase